MMPLYYILDGHEPKAASADEWMKWRCSNDIARVGKTSTALGEVSTVFLGIDHGLVEHGPPILFETIVFGGPYDGDMNRYSTWAEAHAGHKAIVAKLEREIAAGH